MPFPPWEASREKYMWSDMASPKGSRSGDITLEARFFLSAGVETTVHEGSKSKSANPAEILGAKDISMNIGTVNVITGGLKKGFDTETSLDGLHPYLLPDNTSLR